MTRCRESQMALTDFHTHGLAEGVLSLTPGQYRAYPAAGGRLLTVGMHPWDSAVVSQPDMETLVSSLDDPRVVAVGEAGIDPFKGAPIERQIELLKWQLDLAARALKPVVLHVVRRYDTVLKLRKEYPKESQWAVHGFRGKPEMARQLCDAGIYLSLGVKFNPQAAEVVPGSLLLVETDAAGVDITDVIGRVAAARGERAADVAGLAARNLRRFYGI